MDKTTHFFCNLRFRTSNFFNRFKNHIRKCSESSLRLSYHVKKFKTKNHLISMLFCSFAKCTSLREVSGAMLGLAGKTKHFQLNHIPKKILFQMQINGEMLMSLVASIISFLKNTDILSRTEDQLYSFVAFFWTTRIKIGKNHIMSLCNQHYFEGAYF